MIGLWPVPPDLAGQRIDSVLAALAGESRAAAADMIERGWVAVNGKPVAKSAKVSFGDIVALERPDPEVGQVEPVVTLPIAYEDADLIVVDGDPSADVRLLQDRGQKQRNLEPEEVIELAKVAAAKGGIYDTHMRDEDSYSIGLLGSIEETIRIGREAKIPFQD